MSPTVMQRQTAILVVAWLAAAAVGARADQCSGHSSSCGSCVASNGCGWCIPSDGTFGRCTNSSTRCPPGLWTPYSNDCVCMSSTACGSCSTRANCGWCGSSSPPSGWSSRCVGRSDSVVCEQLGGEWYQDPGLCPSPSPTPTPTPMGCAAYTNCVDCMIGNNAVPNTTHPDPSECAWCDLIGRCASASDYNFMDECGADPLLHPTEYVLTRLTCPAPAEIRLNDILVAAIGGALCLLMVGAMRVAAAYATDERFGKGKVMLFDGAAPRSQYWLKVIRYVQWNHPLFSLSYVLPRDPFGTLPRLKWLLTLSMSLIGICILVAQNHNARITPDWVAYVASLGMSAINELQMYVSIMLYRRQCRAGKDGGPGPCDGCYDCCCVGDSCVVGKAKNAAGRTYCWDLCQLCGSGCTFSIYVPILAANAVPVVYGPGVLVAGLAGIVQGWLVFVVKAMVIMAVLPAYMTGELNEYIAAYGGEAEDGSDVLTHYGSVRGMTDAATAPDADPSSSSTPYVPVMDGGDANTTAATTPSGVAVSVSNPNAQPNA